MANTDRCKCLKMVPGTGAHEANINAHCTATSDEQCPKIRSTKRNVGSQCWKVKIVPVCAVTPPEQ